MLTATRYLIIAAALLHTSHGQTPLLQVTYNFGGMPEIISLECLYGGILQRGATYTFRDPEGREKDRSVVSAGRTSYELTVYPTNESLITCMIADVGESESVKVPFNCVGVSVRNG